MPDLILSPIASKTCTKCGECKRATLEFFHAYKRSPDGVRSVCKSCRAVENVVRNAEFTAKKRAHYAENQQRLSGNVRQYYLSNIEAQQASARARHHKNRDARLQQMREYREANKSELLAAQRIRGREAFSARYGIDLQFTLKHRLRSLLRVSLTRGRKSRRMVEILGYSVEELKQHIERQFTHGMGWAEFMAGQIHIDHIVPVASFNITSDSCEEFSACWSLANLRPMWGSENCAKKDTRLTLL